MRIYISGPISDQDAEQCRKIFGEAATIIKGYGYVPISPLELVAHLPPDLPWERYMEVVMPHLFQSDGIWLLPQWQQSRGARIEQFTACEMERKRRYYMFEHIEMLEFESLWKPHGQD